MDCLASPLRAEEGALGRGLRMLHSAQARYSAPQVYFSETFGDGWESLGI